MRVRPVRLRQAVLDELDVVAEARTLAARRQDPAASKVTASDLLREGADLVLAAARHSQQVAPGAPGPPSSHRKGRQPSTAAVEAAAARVASSMAGLPRR